MESEYGELVKELRQAKNGPLRLTTVLNAADAIDALALRVTRLEVIAAELAAEVKDEIVAVLR